MKKQSFMQNVIILVIANLVVKAIGALFKIPLGRLIGKAGMGYFVAGYTIYATMFGIAATGLSVAVSKMVSEAAARNNQHEAGRIFKIAVTFLTVLGLIGSLVLYFGAGRFEIQMENPGVGVGIAAIAPAFFFIAITSAFRGYFQGMQNMYPTAFSEVAEALGKLIIGYALAVYMMPRGLEYAAAGAMLGVSAGTFFSTVLLVITYFLFKRKRGAIRGSGARSRRQLSAELAIIAIPITLSAAASNLTNMIDLMIVKRLMLVPEMTSEFANELYGMYSGFAVTIFNIPLTVVVAIAMSAVPAIAGAIAANGKGRAHTLIISVLRITLLFALPCAVGLYALAQPILQVLFSDADASQLLQILSVAVIFVAYLTVTNAILQAHGKMYIPVITMTIGGIAKFFANYYLIPIKGINGAPIATNICYIIIVVLNMACILKMTQIHLKIWDFYLKPMLAVAVMYIMLHVANPLLYVVYPAIQAIKHGATINTIINLILVISLGGIVYFLALFAVRAIKKEDVIMLPYGNNIAVILEKWKFIR